MILSLNAVEISTPEPKLDQLTSTRPVSGSTSTNSLSAVPLATVAAVTSNGPCHVWPPSVGRWIQRVGMVPVKFGAGQIHLTIREEKRNGRQRPPGSQLQLASPKTW